MSPEEREEALAGVDMDALRYDWGFWGRPEQMPPDDKSWKIFAIVAGRGFGKSRAGAEWVQKMAMDNPGCRIALVGRTAGDVRNVMVEGNSGILGEHANPETVPHYSPATRRLKWANGSMAETFSSEEPAQLRGPQFRLALGTPIPTPNGWTTMGELKAGDEIFDELGELTAVTAVHPVELAPESYRVCFNDGTHIDADANHLWLALSTNDVRYATTHGWGGIPEDWARRGAFGRESKNHVPKTTSELLARLDEPQHRWYVPPVMRPLEYEKRLEPLPIDPWVLGMALGDGASKAPSNIATSKADAGWLVTAARAAGHEGSRVMDDNHVWVPGLIGPWRDLGLYGNKHVPEVYLRASIEDRKALLAGLVDSDGSVEPTGAVRFSNTNRRLIDGYVELARSLGLIPKVYKKRLRHDPRLLESPRVLWVVCLSAPWPIPRMPRKASRQRLAWRPATASRTISSIEPIEPTPMRCITVDSASHLYLAGEGMVPTHNTHAWADETAAWRHIADDSGLNAWDNLRFATRLPQFGQPQIMVTTTPKRTKFMFDLIRDEADPAKRANPAKRVIITRGSTMENAGYLDAGYLEDIVAKYRGTRLEQQELMGLMLDALEGALWNEAEIEAHRVGVAGRPAKPAGLPLRIIAVDPSVSERPGDECGIIVAEATRQRKPSDRHCYIIEDASLQASPADWAIRVGELFDKYRCPVVVEVNQGGALVKNSIHAINPRIPVLEVRATQGKALRAEPVTLKYQQGKVHHVGTFAELESQMQTWVPGEGKSPDRLDALVYAVLALIVTPPKQIGSGPLRARSFASRQLPGAKRPR